jgi:glutamate 5-kinase
MSGTAGARPVVVKIGTSSLVASDGGLDLAAIAKLAEEVGQQSRAGRRVAVVSSGAVAAGRAAAAENVAVGAAETRALSAIGQPRLMRAYQDAFGAEGILTAQVLISLRDFGVRRQYLRARATIETLWSAEAVPIVNENDALLDGEVRFGDNDRLAALVANLVGAEVLVILTDTPGLYDADPRRVGGATLVEEVAASDAAFDEFAGGPGSARGTGGMGTKLAAARLAAWSGVRAVIAEATRQNVVAQSVDGTARVGTTILARSERLPARKAWIAFALPARARVFVDEGARRAVLERDASLLPAGVRGVEGRFEEGDAVEICDLSGAVFAKGLARVGSVNQSAWIGKRSQEIGEGFAVEVVHRDDLVVLEASVARVAPLSGAP